MNVTLTAEQWASIQTQLGRDCDGSYCCSSSVHLLGCFRSTVNTPDRPTSAMLVVPGDLPQIDATVVGASASVGIEHGRTTAEMVDIWRDGHRVAPKLWTDLTGPCKTCADSGWRGYVPADVSEMSGQSLNDCGGGQPFKKCPACKGSGRERVELRVTCEVCDGDPQGLMQRRWPDGDFTIWPCSADCELGSVLVATCLVEVLPVVAESGTFDAEVYSTTNGYVIIQRVLGDPSRGENVTSEHLGKLDPLPVPGRDWVVVLTDIDSASHEVVA